jgi:TRAP-type C4-dicarboxylate transport system substrate-binding protein
MKKLFLIFFVIVIAGCLVFSGCGGTSTTTITATETATTKMTTTQTATATTTQTATATTTTVVQPIKLSFGSSFPAMHPIEVSHQKWIDKIKEDTNGRVQITLYPAETLVHMFTAWDELKSGVADIINFSMDSSQYGFPIGKALATFMYGTDVITSRQIYAELAKEFPEINAELNGVKVLCYRATISNYLFTKKPIHTLDDLKGLQLQQSPSWPGLPEKLGSTSVNVPFMEVYPSLEKGIIDGSFMPADILKSGSLYEVIGYGINLHSAPPPEGFVLMTLDSWNRLPPDIQKVFDDDFQWAVDEGTQIMEQADQDSLDFAKANGVQFSELPPAELDKLYGYIDEISLVKAAELDAQGLPGTKIYNELKRIKGELLAKK